jgi:hypothetical protein
MRRTFLLDEKFGRRPKYRHVGNLSATRPQRNVVRTIKRSRRIQSYCSQPDVRSCEDNAMEAVPAAPTNRLEGFSDGVFSIAITLLVLDI